MIHEFRNLDVRLVSPWHLKPSAQHKIHTHGQDASLGALGSPAMSVIRMLAHSFYKPLCSDMGSEQICLINLLYLYIQKNTAHWKREWSIE